MKAGARSFSSLKRVQCHVGQDSLAPPTPWQSFWCPGRGLKPDWEHFKWQNKMLTCKREYINTYSQLRASRDSPQCTYLPQRERQDSAQSKAAQYRIEAGTGAGIACSALLNTEPNLLTANVGLNPNPAQEKNISANTSLFIRNRGRY